MTRQRKRMLDYALPQHIGKTFLLTAYAMGAASAPEIPDPYGGSVEEYAQCFSVLESQIAMVFEKIKKNNEV
jgi:protein-tyrosine-phosphatase